MQQAVRTVWANPYVKVTVGIFVLYVLFRLFVALQPAGTVFLAGLGIAYLVNPLIDWLQDRGLGRGIGVAVVGVTLVVTTVGGLGYSFSAIRTTLTETEEGIGLSEATSEWFQQFPQNLEQLVPDPVYALISGPVRSWREATTPRIEEVGGQIYTTVSSTVAIFAQVALILIVAIYVLYDFHGFVASLLRVVPRPYQATTRDLATALDEATGGYIRGQVLIAIAVGLMVFVGLSLIGLPLAGFIGFLAGFLNVVPFIGTIVPVIPAVVLAVSGGWVQVILVLVVFFVANQIDSHVLTPMVLSRATLLHPVTVMVVVIAGFAAGGLLTAILAVPVAAFLKALYVNGYLHSDFHRRG